MSLAAAARRERVSARRRPSARNAARVFEIAVRRSRSLRAGVAVAALALLAVPYVYQLGAWPLTEPDEGRNAEVAREMLQLGSWSLPYFNGLPYLDKPVLLFWVIAGVYRVLGVSEFAARLPSVFAALATVILTFAIGRVLFGARRAAIAAIVVATMPLVLVFARAPIFDMLLTALVTAAIFALLQARRTGRLWRWWPIAGATIGLALLCKGPIGVAMPLLVWGAGRGALPAMPSRARALPAVAAIVLAIAIVVPWLVAVEHAQPGFLRYALVEETFARMTDTETFHRPGPLYYYAGVLAWAAGAWGVLLLVLTPTLARRRRSGGTDAAGIAFAARAVVVLLAFFSVLASKRPQYMLPGLVPLALLVAAGAVAAPRRVVQTARALGAAALLIALGSALLAHSHFTPAQGPLRVVTPEALAALGSVLAIWGALATLGARSPTAALACLAVLGPAVGMGLLSPLAEYAESRSARDLAPNIPPGSAVVALETFHTSLPFYLERPVTLVSKDGHELTSHYVLTMRSRFMGRGYLQPLDRFADVVDADDRAVVLTTRDANTVTELAKRPFVAVYSSRRDRLLRPAS